MDTSIIVGMMDMANIVTTFIVLNKVGMMATVNTSIMMGAVAMVDTMSTYIVMGKVGMMATVSTSIVMTTVCMMGMVGTSVMVCTSAEVSMVCMTMATRLTNFSDDNSMFTAIFPNKVVQAQEIHHAEKVSQTLIPHHNCPVCVSGRPGYDTHVNSIKDICPKLYLGTTRVITMYTVLRRAQALQEFPVHAAFSVKLFKELHLSVQTGSQTEITSL